MKSEIRSYALMGVLFIGFICLFLNGIGSKTVDVRFTGMEKVAAVSENTAYTTYFVKVQSKAGTTQSIVGICVDKDVECHNTTETLLNEWIAKDIVNIRNNTKAIIDGRLKNLNTGTPIVSYLAMYRTPIYLLLVLCIIAFLSSFFKFKE